MTNHPNRSKSADLRYVVYSVASHNALAADGNMDGALDRARSITGGSDEFCVVFSTRSRDDLDRFDGGRWPHDAKVEWRGANALAQRYKA